MILQIHSVETIHLYSRRRVRRKNVEFYRDLLELPLVCAQCDTTRLLFRLHQRELQIELTDRVDVNGHYVRATFEVADLERTADLLAEHGHPSELHRGWSPAADRLFVLDPTGYRIELFKSWRLY